MTAADRKWSEFPKALSDDLTEWVPEFNRKWHGATVKGLVVTREQRRGVEATVVRFELSRDGQVENYAYATTEPEAFSQSGDDPVRAACLARLDIESELIATIQERATVGPDEGGIRWILDEPT